MESVEQNNSKKKLIVPLIALMLCAVAVIGIGYGLNSTSTNTNNAVSGTGLVVDLNNGTESLGEGGFFTNSAQKAITYTSTQSNGNFTYTVSGGEIGKGILKITSTDKTKTTAKVTATLSLQNCENSSAFTFTMDGKTLTLDKATALDDVTLTSGEASPEYTLILDAGDPSVKPDVAFTYTIVFSVDVN